MQGSKDFSQLMEALSFITDLNETRELNHGKRVGVLAALMAEEFEMVTADQVFYGGIIHDIGSMPGSDHVTNHPDMASQIADPVFRLHSQMGFYISREIPGMREAPLYILDHHERWNGTGYPQAKFGSEISFGGQLMRIADSFDLYLRHDSDPASKNILRLFHSRVGREFSPEVFDCLAAVLHPELFERIVDDDRLNVLFNEIKKRYAARHTDFKPADVEQIARIFGYVIDTKHGYTAGHSKRVARYGARIGREMGLEPEVVRKIELAGHLHDIGKVGVPVQILNKKGRLTGEEFDRMKRHPLLTMQILDKVNLLRDIVKGAGHHHERFDGAGYPNGLRGDDIPMISRILAIADTFDSLNSFRPYRTPSKPGEIVDYIEKQAGTQFDPALVPFAKKALAA